MKKRPITLVAAILGAVVAAVYVVSIAINYSELFSGFMSLIRKGDIIMGYLTLLAPMCALYAIVRNISSIKLFSCDHEMYASKRQIKGRNRAILLNVILPVCLIVLMTKSFGALQLVVAIGAIASAVLYIVDAYLEKKRYALSADTASSAATVTTSTTTSYAVEAKSVDTETKTADTEVNTKTVEKTVEKQD